MMDEHVILVAFTVFGDTRETAEAALTQAIDIYHLQERVTVVDPDGNYPAVDSWWVAEDDRNDGSDNDSAVFVTPGNKAAAASLLLAEGLSSLSSN